jgi:hypothetical protein
MYIIICITGRTRFTTGLGSKKKQGRKMKSRKTRPQYDPFYDRVRCQQNRVVK